MPYYFDLAINTLDAMGCQQEIAKQIINL